MHTHSASFRHGRSCFHPFLEQIGFPALQSSLDVYTSRLLVLETGVESSRRWAAAYMSDIQYTSRNHTSLRVRPQAEFTYPDTDRSPIFHHHALHIHTFKYMHTRISGPPGKLYAVHNATNVHALRYITSGIVYTVPPPPGLFYIHDSA